MKRNFFIALGLVIFLSIALMGYGVYVNYAGESSISERMTERAILINAGVVKTRTIQAEYMMNEVKFQADNAVDIIARTDGTVKQSMLYKNKNVSAGEVVAILENELMPLNITSAASNVKKAQAEEIRAKNTYERHAKLMEMDATSLEKLDEAKAEYEAAMANMEDAQARYEQAVVEKDHLEIVSPVSGCVVVIYKQKGSFVTAGTPVCMVADFDNMWFAVNMPEYTIRSLLGNEGIGSLFTMYSKNIGNDKAYNTEYAADNMGAQTKFNVSIRGIYPGLEEPADMRRVVFYVDNRRAVLEPRSYRYLVLQANTPRSILSVNIKALFDNDNNSNRQYVFVVTEDNRLEKRMVEIGAVNNEYAEVLSGLKDGEIVVTSGVDGLIDGEKVMINDLEDN